MEKFKVVYHVGTQIGIKTKVKSGFVLVDIEKITLTTRKGEFIMDLSAISKISLFMLNGLGSTLKLEVNGKNMFLMVVRFCIAGQFATGNFFGTRAIKRKLESRIGAD